MEFCSLITRDPATGLITRVNDVLLNVNQQITKGLDMELDYRQPMGGLGDTSLRILATYVFDLITVDSAGPVNRAGQTGLRATTIPDIPRYTTARATTCCSIQSGGISRSGCVTSFERRLPFFAAGGSDWFRMHGTKHSPGLIRVVHFSFEFTDSRAVT
jgi:hypothetical protein